eukprot:COSAG02_NODE_1104_length_14560_cov_5.927322_12_plen_261_part_00
MYGSPLVPCARVDHLLQIDRNLRKGCLASCQHLLREVVATRVTVLAVGGIHVRTGALDTGNVASHVRDRGTCFDGDTATLAGVFDLVAFSVRAPAVAGGAVALHRLVVATLVALWDEAADRVLGSGERGSAGARSAHDGGSRRGTVGIEIHPVGHRPRLHAAVLTIAEGGAVLVPTGATTAAAVVPTATVPIAVRLATDPPKRGTGLLAECGAVSITGRLAVHHGAATESPVHDGASVAPVVPRSAACNTQTYRKDLDVR